MSNNTEKTRHAVGDDIFLCMGHKKYKTSMAYSRALFNFAIQFDLLKLIQKSFDDFMHLWEKQPLVRGFIQCNAIDRFTRKGKIRALFEAQVHHSFLCFLERLIDNNHSDLLPGIYNIFSSMTDEVGKRRKVRVISAFPMNDTQKKRLKETLENSLKLDVILQNEVDPGILGGFVCYTDSIKIDMSIKKDLERLKSRILSTPCEGEKKDESKSG